MFFVNYGLLVFAKSRSAECLEGCTPTCVFQRAVERGKGCAGEETGEMEQRHTGDVKGVMVKGGSNSMEHGASGRTAEDELRTGKA